VEVKREKEEWNHHTYNKKDMYVFVCMYMCVCCENRLIWMNLEGRWVVDPIQCMQNVMGLDTTRHWHRYGHTKLCYPVVIWFIFCLCDVYVHIRKCACTYRHMQLKEKRILVGDDDGIKEFLDRVVDSFHLIYFTHFNFVWLCVHSQVHACTYVDAENCMLMLDKLKEKRILDRFGDSFHLISSHWIRMEMKMIEWVPLCLSMYVCLYVCDCFAHSTEYSLISGNQTGQTTWFIYIVWVHWNESIECVCLWCLFISSWSLYFLY